MIHDPLPLFPLRTVLFPGGILPLRIFEARYLDMVRDCMRKNSGFGVCLVLEGSETASASAAAVGCEAKIVDFETRDDGLLGIVCHGHRRFHVEKAQVRSDGLLVGDVRWLNEESTQALAPEYSLLATMLERFLEKTNARYPQQLLQDAEWVAWRFAECLPLTGPQRLHLLQLNESEQRLQWLLDHLPDFQTD
jgi:uncharacterized protein